MEIKTFSFLDEEALELVRKGEVIALPTETVYGLGVKYSSKEAFDKLVSAKNRNPDKPFTLMLKDKNEVGKYAYVDEKAQKVIDVFMPGEITLLLKPRENLYPWVTLSSPTIGIRVAGLLDVGDFIKRVGEPMLVTSANISSFPACTTYEETFETFKDRIKGIIKGETSSSVPSTIVLLGDNNIKLIRQGSIPFEKIKEVWEGE